MFKKIALSAVILCAAPFLSRNFRAGFKQGFNEQIDQEKLKKPDQWTPPKFTIV